MEVTALHGIPGYISSRLMAAWDLPDGHTLHVGAAEHQPSDRVAWHYALEQAGTVIFEGSDLCTAGVQSYAEVARTLLSFLTLRPGDTDAEYFDSYTPEQLAWRDQHAEALSIYGDP